MGLLTVTNRYWQGFHMVKVMYCIDIFNKSSVGCYDFMHRPGCSAQAKTGRMDDTTRLPICFQIIGKVTRK